MKKSNLIQLTALCFIMSLTAACGGKNSSGGNGIPNSAINAISSADSGVLPSIYVGTPQGQNIVNIFNEALAWRNSTTENGAISSSGFTRGAVVESSTCSGKTISLGFLGSVCISSLNNRLITFETTPTQYCTVKNSDNTISFASAVSNEIPYHYYGCNLPGLAVYSKDKNSELNTLFTLNGGTWHLYDSFKSGSYYEFAVGPKNSGPSFIYTLNTAKHSVYNPQAIAKARAVNLGWGQIQIQITGNIIRTMELQ